MPYSRLLGVALCRVLIAISLFLQGAPEASNLRVGGSNPSGVPFGDVAEIA